MIGIIDIALSNVQSVKRALDHIGSPSKMIWNPNDFTGVQKLIFPGVGTFSEASKRLQQSSLKDQIRRSVIDEKIPILGICLGMQLLFREGEEGGLSAGLELLEGRVIRMAPPGDQFRLPHIGWNDVQFRGLKLFNGLNEPQSTFYFVHSYHAVVEDPAVQFALTDYGLSFVSAVQKDHIFGVQFHPEKSQMAGLHLLKNFAQGSVLC